MVIIPGPAEFWMGSPRTEAERFSGPGGRVEMHHYRRIGRSFALAANEVTVEQFLKFRPNQFYTKQYSPTSDHPINTVTWFDAAAYCNWLSKQEGIPEDQWGYVPNSMGQYAAGMRVKPDALSLRGYRLPTEAEWEYACRAGVTDARYYGETEELLTRYAWYFMNSNNKNMALPGSFRPNDLGLFDLLGNAEEWCEDPASFYPAGTRDRLKEDDLSIQDTKSIDNQLERILRGSSFGISAPVMRSASRDPYLPKGGLVNHGFRPARTYR
jgi:formylglycine-generating enzyme required for sulfatase activity